jgi:hypothetical protein
VEIGFIGLVDFGRNQPHESARERERENSWDAPDFPTRLLNRRISLGERFMKGPRDACEWLGITNCARDQTHIVTKCRVICTC